MAMFFSDPPVPLIGRQWDAPCPIILFPPPDPRSAHRTEKCRREGIRLKQRVRVSPLSGNTEALNPDPLVGGQDFNMLKSRP